MTKERAKATLTLFYGIDKPSVEQIELFRRLNIVLLYRKGDVFIWKPAREARTYG